MYRKFEEARLYLGTKNPKVCESICLNYIGEHMPNLSICLNYIGEHCD